MWTVRRTWVVLVFLLTPVNAAFPQVLRTIQVDFEKLFREKDTEEIVKGTIYHDASGKTILSVRHPVNQWMISSGHRLVIYYPEEGRAFRFITRSHFHFPFFQAFLGVVKEDYGLTDMGYTLSSHEILGDTLTTCWSPPERLSQELGDLTVVYVSDRIIRIESRKTDGSVISRALYENHLRHGIHQFPLKICTIRYEEKDSTFERIKYGNPMFNVDFPETVKEFALPADTKIEEITW